VVDDNLLLVLDGLEKGEKGRVVVVVVAAATQLGERTVWLMTTLVVVVVVVGAPTTLVGCCLIVVVTPAEPLRLHITIRPLKASATGEETRGGDGNGNKRETYMVVEEGNKEGGV